MKLGKQMLQTEQELALVAELKLKFLIHLYSDVVTFNNKIKEPFSGGLPYLSVVPSNLHDVFTKCLLDPQQQFQKHLETIEEFIVNTVYSDCSVHVKKILQIPRLYRKTNRNTPVSPSAYLSSMTQPVNSFYEKSKSQLADVVLKRIIGAIHMKIIME